MSEVLFEITKENLETGLRGYPVGYCTTSYVDPEKGLYYVGTRVSELTHHEPLEVVYLLMHGRQGSKEEVRAFERDLTLRSALSDDLLAAINHLPRKGHPMKLFSAALLLCGMMEGRGDYREDCLDLIAKVPHIAAAVINRHAGWGSTPKPNPELGYMENFVQLLNLKPKVDRIKLVQVLKLFNILHYDHGGGNLSTFVGKAIASGLEDMYGSIAGAMCALEGPRHGRANQDCLHFVQTVLQEVGESASEAAVEALLRSRLASNQLIFGFGHAVLRVEDPRATSFYDFLKAHYPDHPYTHIALLLRAVGPKVLKENPKISDPYPNVDAVSGSLLFAAGFTHPEYFTLLFGMSRCIGIARQIVYERNEARGGKGCPIVRPKYFYKAP